ncbi:MAG: L-seryl-tRNA(Sec) selenium transferase [Candidatus Eisenbacteria bacterium]|nr:L-seryl-tRNA(Sec) selenium transferase [Candidatus Eisenbacteria bacterium]
MDEDRSPLFRVLPSVEKLLADPEVGRALEGVPRAVAVEAVRLAVERMRERIRGGEAPAGAELAAAGTYAARAREEARRLLRPSLGRVINATGIVIHTNLGRAPVAPEAFERAREVATRYSNLEYDLERGARGSRMVHAEALLRRLTGAEAALVTNNNAAAVLVSLNALAFGRKVVVSRGELIEIGGSFRLPEIMQASGAILCEVGTTNRTHPEDYRRALDDKTALLMKVHLSNFRVEGFTAAVAADELVRIGAERGIPLLYDLGSGAFARTGPGGEPTAPEELGSGAALITMSGDKLLGAVQAGIILGKREVVDRVRKAPMMRAVRVDKITLALLEATLTAYLDPDRVVENVPVLRLISRPLRDIQKDVETLRGSILRRAGDAVHTEIVEGESEAGGGAIGQPPIPTVLLAISIDGMRPEAVAAALRGADPPIVARVREDRIRIDPRTLFPEEIAVVADTIVRIAAGGGRRGEVV